jgi:prepilin-type N-terminal cleavage/methylation domain-containing protein
MVKNIKENKGFTILEIIVTFSVISILASYMILYNKANKAQIVLSLEQAALVGAINTAKSLTLSTYIENNSSCGYGVYIDYQNKSYEIFKYGQIPQTDCGTIASSTLDSIRLSNFYTKIKNVKLPKEVIFDSSGNNKLDSIFFIPPDPKVLIWRDNSGLPINELNMNYESYIYLKTTDNSITKKIKINIAGQISFN